MHTYTNNNTNKCKNIYQFFKITKEHRESLCKNAKSFHVKCCKNIREIRNKEIKAVKHKTGLAKDLVFRIENSIDSLSHQFTTTAEQMLESKQKELLGNSDSKYVNSYHFYCIVNVYYY